MDELRIVGPFARHSGYSKMTRAALRTALLAGYRVQAIESDYRLKLTGMADGRIVETRLYHTPSRKRPLPPCQAEEVRAAKRLRVKPDAPTLFIQIPPSLENHPEYSSGPRIGWTMLESDRLHPDWRRGVHGIDLLLAPSNYCLDTFRRDAPYVHSDLMPCPVDDRLWSIEGNGTGIGGRLPGFLFLSVFETRERKQWRMMLQAFAEEFDPDEDVGLIVKPGRATEVLELAGWLNQKSTRRRIIVLREWLSDDTLAAWYRRCDCYVLPSAEGFGLPYVEAAMCGKPSIALDIGGAADVVDRLTGYLVPGRMRPVIGNFPHVYTSDHLFPTPLHIEHVKTAFRQAWCHAQEDSKGAAARQRAMEMFSPSALAPRLVQHVDAARDIFSGRGALRSSVVSEPSWALCIGDGYGDAIASYGNARGVLPPDGFSFLHYGYNEGAAAFLRQQPGVIGVHRVEPESPERYAEVAALAGGYNTDPQDWLPEILRGTYINQGQVAQTQVRWRWGAWPVHRPQGMALSEEAQEWAQAKASSLGRFLLVQPYSVGNSVSWGDHWPHWSAFLRWLVGRGLLIVLCGQAKLHGTDRPNVTDLVGETPTVQHMLALAHHASGVITTCNALANWTVCNGIPALVAANAAIPHKTGFWYRFMDAAPNTLLPYKTTLPQMQAAAEKWFEERGC